MFSKAIGWWLLSAGSIHAQVFQLIQHGNFEDLPLGALIAPGYTGGLITALNPIEGNQSLYLDAASFTFTVPTVSGHLYELHYWMRARIVVPPVLGGLAPAATPEMRTIVVSGAQGTPLTTVYNSPSNSNPIEAPITQWWATGGSTVITIQSTGGAWIDSVKTADITPVPEPEWSAAFALGLLSIYGLYLKRSALRN